MNEQLSLFIEENTLFNTGIRQLLDMQFSECKETLRYYRRLYPWGRDPGREIGMAEFWLGNLGCDDQPEIEPAEAEKRYCLWLEFEKTFGHPWPEESIEKRLQVRYFRRIADGLVESRGADVTKLPGGTPVGLIFLWAERPDPAVRALQALIPIETDAASVYGYLGDAYALRGDLRTARNCYREAFVIAPDKVDIAHLRDIELRERLEEFETNESPGSNPLGWFPIVAQLDGFFERRIIKDLGELKEWIKIYLDLLKIFLKDGDQDHIPGLFYHAMVLSYNAPIMKFITKVDLIEIRQKMREWHPDLFSRHMRALERKDELSRGRFP